MYINQPLICPKTLKGFPLFIIFPTPQINIPIYIPETTKQKDYSI